jgi:small subunit ribosomal protein S21
MSVKLEYNEDEPIENSIRRFKRSVNQSGHLMTMRFREQWETKAEEAKRKKEKANLMKRIERTNDKYEAKAQGKSEYNS